jgi:sugar-specific transcriptional regulator TrmB
MFNLEFLNEFGLSDIQIKIYEYLIKNRFGTIKDIKEHINKSFAQVRNNLKILEANNFITSSEGKPKLFFRVNPKISLTALLKRRNQNIISYINQLVDDIKIYESEKGLCTRNITFYHHSDINTGIDYIYNLIENSKTEIIISSLPPSLLKSFESALHLAFLEGAEIKLYYSKSDFETISNYFERVTAILKDVNLTLIETNEKTCRLVRFNDLLVNEGVILADDYFNSVLFIDDTFFHFNGFYMPNTVQGVKNMLNAKNVIKKVVVKPEPLQSIIDIITNNESIKTNDLSDKVKLGGTKLREFLDFLLSKGVIEETIITSGKPGRPKRVYSIVEE